MGPVSPTLLELLRGSPIPASLSLSPGIEKWGVGSASKDDHHFSEQTPPRSAGPRVSDLDFVSDPETITGRRLLKKLAGHASL